MIFAVGEGMAVAKAHVNLVDEKVHFVAGSVGAHVDAESPSLA